MAIYLLVFGVVIFLSYIAQKKSDKNFKFSCFIVFLIILILSMLGGLRALSVGTDLRVYGYNWFKYACKAQNFESYRKIISTTDIGYLGINFIVSRFTSNFNVFLFVLQIICNSLIFITLFKYRKETSFTFATIVYLTIYYCRSYNYLRQSVALAVIFFGYPFLKEKKVIKYIVTVIIASQFHFTGYVALAVYPIYILINNNMKTKTKIIITMLIVVFTIIVTVNIIPMIKLLYTMNIINQRIYAYILNYALESFDFSLIESCFKMVFICIYLFNFKVLNKESNENLFFLVALILDMIFFQIRGVISYADRFSLYYGYFAMLCLPKVPSSFKINNSKIIIGTTLIVMLFSFWGFKFVYEHSGEAYPYKFVTYK